jgi:hypothetical protein
MLRGSSLTNPATLVNFVGGNNSLVGNRAKASGRVIRIEYGGYPELFHQGQGEYVCFVSGVQELEVGDGHKGGYPANIVVKGDPSLHGYVIEFAEGFPVRIDFPEASLNHPFRKEVAAG